MTYVKEDIKCPKCNQKGRAKIYKELNKDDFNKIISKEFLKYECDKCHENIILNYDMDYIDDEFHVYYRTDNKVIPKDKFYLSRVTYSHDDFKEKIMIFNDHLNDLAITFLKCYVMENLDDKSKVTDIRYNGSDDDVIVFYLFGLNQKVSLKKEFYNILMNKSKIKKIKECVLIDEMTFRKYLKVR